MQEVQLPNFLKQYLSLDDSGSAYAALSCTYDMYPTRHWAYVYDGNWIDVFRAVYLVLINKFEYRFSFINNDNANLKFNIESDLLMHNLNRPPYYSFSVVLDCPLYWYDSFNNAMGLSYLKDGLLFNVDRMNPKSGGSPFSMHLHFNHTLFSNRIVRLDTFGTDNPEYLHFEPAAIENRLRIRNLALEIQALYPNMLIEFSGRKSRIRPYDNYGFLEGADYVINPED